MEKMPLELIVVMMRMPFLQELKSRIFLALDDDGKLVAILRDVHGHAVNDGLGIWGWGHDLSLLLHSPTHRRRRGHWLV